MNFNVGDKVLIKMNYEKSNSHEVRSSFGPTHYFSSDMDIYYNKIMTIRYIESDYSIYMKEDINQFHGNYNDGWVWSPEWLCKI